MIREHRVLFVRAPGSTVERLAGDLAGEGYRTRLARDGSAASGAAAAFRPDLLVVDLELPDYGGFQAAGRLAVDHPGLPALYLFGGGLQEELVAGFAFGGDTYIRLPVGHTVFVEHVRRVVGRARPAAAAATVGVGSGRSLA